MSNKSLLSFLGPKRQNVSEVDNLLAENASSIAAAQTAMPALRTALDEASLRGSGDAEALAKVRSAEAELERLHHRDGVLRRAREEAIAMEAAAKLDQLKKRARTAAAKQAADLAKYDTDAVALAASVAAIEAGEAQLQTLNREIEDAGGEAIPYPQADHVSDGVVLPAANWRASAHREPRATANPQLVAMGQMLREARAELQSAAALRH